MMHRARRAKLLLPSFVAVLGACGGTTVGSDPDGQAGAAGGAEIAGGAGYVYGVGGISTNPPPPEWMYGGGGAGGGQGGYAGGYSIGGYGANPPIIQPYPVCPPQAPTESGACYSIGAVCTYPTACGEEWALCGGLGWSLGTTADSGCAGDGGASTGGAGPIEPPPPPGPLSCPTEAPHQSQPCYLPGDVANYECDYGPCRETQAVCNGLWNVKTSAVDCIGI